MKVNNICDALGGINNVCNVETCHSRVCVTVRDGLLVSEQLLRREGMYGIVVQGNWVHLIVGSQASVLAQDMQECLNVSCQPVVA
ncbi:MAG: PTS sugar transporter [Actinomycetaceae bacterium]|nr:PTS sugar transporter [Actinomycetaceae bacterium]